MEKTMPKTDNEIVAMAVQEWTAILRRLWVASGKSPEKDDERFQAYYNSLGSVPLGLLEKAIDALLQKHTYATVPQLGEVWNEIRIELSAKRCYSVDDWLRVYPSGVYKFENEVVI